jgi:hypothetical protein
MVAQQHAGRRLDVNVRVNASGARSPDHPADDSRLSFWAPSSAGQRFLDFPKEIRVRKLS